jgi:hypothetical protein
MGPASRSWLALAHRSKSTISRPSPSLSLPITQRPASGVLRPSPSTRCSLPSRAARPRLPPKQTSCRPSASVEPSSCSSARNLDTVAEISHPLPHPRRPLPPARHSVIHEMDQRQPPHSFPRSQDRPLIQNPNHAPAPQQQSQPQPQSTLYHPSTSQQPPVQIPFSDPFQRRAPDPFLPNTHAQRRGSYGLPSGREAGSGGHGDRAPLAGVWGSTTGMHPFHNHIRARGSRRGSQARVLVPYLELPTVCSAGRITLSPLQRVGRDRGTSSGQRTKVGMTARGHVMFPHAALCPSLAGRVLFFAPVSW